MEDDMAKKLKEIEEETKKIFNLTQFQPKLKIEDLAISYLNEKMKKDEKKIEYSPISKEVYRKKQQEIDIQQVKRDIEIGDRMQTERKKIDKLLIDIGHIPEQNILLKQQIEDNKIASDEQINNLKTIIKENKDSSVKQDKTNMLIIIVSIIIALISIGMSIYFSIQTMKQSEDFFQQENNSSTIQHLDLMRAVKNITPEEEILMLNKIFTSLQEIKIVEKTDFNKTK